MVEGLRTYNCLFSQTRQSIVTLTKIPHPASLPGIPEHLTVYCAPGVRKFILAWGGGGEFERYLSFGLVDGVLTLVFSWFVGARGFSRTGFLSVSEWLTQKASSTPSREFLKMS